MITEPKQPIYQESDFQVYFYALVDPLTGETCYVGQTGNPGNRLRQHCQPEIYCRNAHLASWIFDLSERKLYPRMEIIETTTDLETWSKPTDHENELIRHYWRAGAPLLNRRPRMKNWTKRIETSQAWQRVKARGCANDTLS